MAVKGFVFFYDWEKPFEMLNGDEFKEMFMAMLRFQRDNTSPPEFSGISAVVASFIFPQLSRRRQKADAGKKGGEARWEKENAENCAEKESDSDFFDENCANSKTIPHRQDKDKDNNTDFDKDSDSDKDKDAPSQGVTDAQSIVLPFSSGGYAIADSVVEKYAKKYPALRVRDELSRMAQWLKDNPRPRSAAPKFINGWLYAENAKACADGNAYDLADAAKNINKNADKTVRQAPSYDIEEFFRVAVNRSMGSVADNVGDIPHYSSSRVDTL